MRTISLMMQVVFLPAIVMLAGCTGSPAPVEPKQISGSQPSAAGAETGAKHAQDGPATIPADFPKDVPLYHGMTLQAVTVVTASKSYVIQAVTPDAIEPIEQAIRRDALAQGWNENTPSTTVHDSALSSLAFSKSGRDLHITLIREGTNTIINLVTGAVPGPAPAK